MEQTHFRNAVVVLVGMTAAMWAGPAEAADHGLKAVYRRAAADIKAGLPLVVTVHVALCDNAAIHCGGGGLGRGDRPGKNLYWGGAAGFRAYFDRARGYRRVHLDRGDGEVVLERAVYRRKVRRPSVTWRRLGVTRPFEVYLVGLAYRGEAIGQATRALVEQVNGEASATLRLTSGKVLTFGGGGHLVGYAGHNHLMDTRDFHFPRFSRTRPVAFFALSCMNSGYLAEAMLSRLTPAVLLTRTLMYPGAFTIDGLVRGLAGGDPLARVFLRGAKMYAHFQRRPLRRIRAAFTHSGRKKLAGLAARARPDANPGVD